jgi:hypothetical protein
MGSAQNQTTIIQTIFDRLYGTTFLRKIWMKMTILLSTTTSDLTLFVAIAIARPPPLSLSP